MNLSPTRSQNISVPQSTALPNRGSKTDSIAPPGASALEGQLLSVATLDAQQMASMNFAREEFRRLEILIHREIIPAFPMKGGDEHPLVVDLRRHLEQVRIFSASFCYRHRHLGASHGCVGEQDVSQ